ncbi:MAG: hypothetical protein CMJ64_18030 [Planctomycetaceae bacterium]|nr:hypothetical protein [Planctomycetaceae bacterium]
MKDDSANGHSRSRTLATIFGLSLVVRAAVVVGLFGSLQADPDAYRKLAENVRSQGVYTTTGSPTAFRPPLYPLLLLMTVVDGTVSSAMVAVLHVVLGAGTVLLTFLLAEACGLKRVAYLAAALVAIDPILLNQSALVMTETLATLLAVAGTFALARAAHMPTMSSAGFAGFVIGLAALCRPTFLPWLGIAGVLLSGRKHVTSFNRKPEACASSSSSEARASGLRLNVRFAALYFVVAASVISPWAIRNLVVLGRPKVTTTHGGYTILLGNNPSFYQYLREREPDDTWDATPLANIWRWRHVSNSPQDEMWDLVQLQASKNAWRDLGYDEPIFEASTPIIRSEFEDDAFAYSLARRYITDEPGMFAYACWVRVGRLWQMFPYPRNDSESTARKTLRVLTGCWYTVLFLLAACGAITCRKELLRSPLVWGVVLCFTFTAVHSVYWSNMRMRAPLMPIVCVLASFGMVAIAERLCRRKL